MLAGPLVRAACKRHLDDLATGAARGLVWHPDKALRAIQFFPDVLRLVDIENDAVTGEKIALIDGAPPFQLSPWQEFIVGSLFGWYTAAGFRRFRVGYIEVGKGNGKSPLAAGIGLYMLTADGARNAEVYAAAAVKDQARVQYRDAVNMVDASDDLSEILVKHGDKEVYNLVHGKSNSFFKPISSEKRGLDGKRVHCALIDELHEHPNATVADKMRAGTKGRRNALIFEITNSGFDRTSVCYQHHEYSDRVVHGVRRDDAWFAYVAGVDEDDDPMVDEGCWIKANPNLGVSIDPTYLRELVHAANGMPSNESLVRRLNFCQWVDAESPWIDGPSWRACEKEFDALAELAGCDEVVGALDLSGTLDLTALGLVGLKGGRTVARVEFWTPKDTLEERGRRDKVPYDAWVKAGFINATPGRAVDYEFVAQRIAELQGVIPLRRICFDPYRIKYLEKALDALNIEVELIPHPQGYYKAQAKKDEAGNDLPALWMPRSVEVLEKLVIDKTLDVEKNPCLTWNSASAVLEPDPKDNRIFTKRKSRGRIDGIVTLAMGNGLLHDDSRPKPGTPELRWL